MQPTQVSKADRPPDVEPVIRHAVPWRVVAVTAVRDFRLQVTFVDGTRGEVDLGNFLIDPNTNGTVFEPLRDPAVFTQVGVVMGAVQWTNGADLAPDAMYDAIKAHGQWVVE
jgi:Protein of unknown function (DUF2442)